MINEAKDFNYQIGLNYAEDVIKNYAKSFYLAAQFLPKEKKIGAYAVYCFCRYADNIVDNPRERNIDEIQKELDALKAEIDLIYKYYESENPALMLFAFTIKKYNVPKKYVTELIEGVQMDLYKSRYATFDELYLFCFRVASTVGLMMSYVLGFKEEKALYYAEKLGIGMQLTNILRDIQEDLLQDRFYLPYDELGSYNLNELIFKNNIFNDGVRNYIKFNVDRARDYYKESEPGIKLLNKDARFAIYGASGIYEGILTKIEKNNYNPFLNRVFVPKFEKFNILLSELVKVKLSSQ